MSCFIKTITGSAAIRSVACTKVSAMQAVFQEAVIIMTDYITLCEQMIETMKNDKNNRK
jgi:hypothetical protein